jgi:hypothetical protein
LNGLGSRAIRHSHEDREHNRITARQFHSHTSSLSQQTAFQLATTLPYDSSTH